MKLISKGICSLVLSVLSAFLPAFADAKDDLRIEIEGILSESAVRGAGIVVIEEGAPALEVYWGMADVAADRPVTEETVFRAGSISKNVTSLLALRLIEAGVLEADALIADLAPEIEIKNRWQDTAPIRVIHLLEHTAGLPGSTYREYSENKPDATPQDYLDAAGRLQTRWPPGTLYSYSNAGHTVLARVLESVTGQAFDDLVREQIFAPLGMESASFATYGTDPDLLSKSYSMSGVEQPVWEMLIRPSGALTSTPADLSKLVALYAQIGLVEPDPILSMDAIARMRGSEASAAAETGVGGGAYGLGTFAFIIDQRTYFGHWGKTEGFRANLGYLPETGKGFVIMLNVVDERAASALRSAIAAYLERDLPPEEAINLRAFDGDAYRDKTGSYVLATHDQPLRAWVFKALDQRRISVSEDGLQVAGMGQLAPPETVFQPVQNGGFVADGLPLATAAFFEADGKTYWLDGDAYVKVSGLEAWFRRAIVPAGILVSIIAVLHSLVWGVMGLLGRGPNGQGLLVRASLLASGLGFLVTTGLFVSFALLGDWSALSQVGQPTFVSVTMAAFSLVAVLGGLAAIAFTVRKALSEPSLFLIYAIPTACILAAYAVLWISVGWFPLMTWGW